MAEAFIKLYKKMLQWEWYKNPNTARLFIHCLLKANWKPTRWHGVDLAPGQFVTSISKLSEETGLTVSQVRSNLNALHLTGELTSKTTNKYRVITVNNWCSYQANDKQTDKQTASKLATDKEYKEIKNKRNIYVSDSHKKIHDFSERKINYEELEDEAIGKFD